MEYKEKVTDSYDVIGYSGHNLPRAYFNYILARWLRSFRDKNDYIKLVDSKSYFKAYEPYLKRIITQSSTIIKMAVLSDEPDVTLGFAIFTGTVLHYVYVGSDFRNNGIASALVSIPEAITSFTHLTKAGLELWPKYAPDAIFNPFQ